MKTNLNFKSISYKNFLATGNKEISIDLSAAPTTLIYGKNGAGKSTMYEALYYGLYGKAFRGTKIPELLNNINNKNMLVTVELSVSGVDFKIVRGKKPNVFEIYREGKLVDQTSSAYDYQSYLERHILKMSAATFRLIVILGSLHYVPYMRINKTKDKMAIIEELLDIQIFSEMNKCTREKLNALKREMEKMDNKKDLLQNSIELLENHIKDLDSTSADEKERLANEIEEFSKKVLNAELKVASYREQAEEINLDSAETLRQERDKWKRFETLAEAELKTADETIRFLNENDSCDRCHQEIDEDFKKTRLAETNKTIKKIETAQETKIVPGLKKAIDGLSAIQVMNQKLNSLNTSIVEENSRIDGWNKQLKKLNENLSNKSDVTKLKEKRKELGTYKASLTKLLKRKEEYYIEIEEYDAISKLICDDGIKKNIIKMYVPVINRLISKYLSILGFPIKFTFDEDLKEKIVVKGRRDLSYSSFSAGEKMRVDLAILFAFREIPILRSGNSCNLLIFDEVADSAMDVEGWDQFFTIIDSVTDVGNIFVISPKGDTLTDKFARCMVARKNGAFSELKEEI